MYTTNPWPDGTGQTSPATLLHGFVFSLYCELRLEQIRAFMPEGCTFHFQKWKQHNCSPNLQVRLSDINGNKLPNGEHPAIHWNRCILVYATKKLSSCFDSTKTHIYGYLKQWVMVCNLNTQQICNFFLSFSFWFHRYLKQWVMVWNGYDGRIYISSAFHLADQAFQPARVLVEKLTEEQKNWSASPIFIQSSTLYNHIDNDELS